MERLLPRFDQAEFDPNRHASILVLDSVSKQAAAVAGLSLGGLEALVAAIVDGSGNQVIPMATPPAGAIKSVSGTFGSSGDNAAIAAVTSKRLKILSYALFTASTTQVNAIFKDGNGGTQIWEVPLLALSSAIFGANLATAYPSFLFATSAGNLLDLNLSASQTVYYNLTYWDSDAT